MTREECIRQRLGNRAERSEFYLPRVGDLEALQLLLRLSLIELASVAMLLIVLR